jgi:hypothetical protein
MIGWQLKSEEWEGPFPAIPLGKAGSLRHFAPCGKPGTGVEARLTAYNSVEATLINYPEDLAKKVRSWVFG